MRSEVLAESRHRAAADRLRRVAGQTAGTIGAALFILALPASLILGAVRFAFSWQPVYTYAIETYHADQISGIPQSELLRATHSIRTYFTDNRRDLDITVRNDAGQLEPLFNAREIAHMRDVKALVQRVYLLLAIAIAYVVLYTVASLWLLHRPLRRFARELQRASVITALLIVAFGVAAAFDFDQIFTEFHVISFSNDFWQLDPLTDHLIQMFPSGFWLDVTLFVGLLALTGALFLAFLSRLYLWMSARRRRLSL